MVFLPELRISSKIIVTTEIENYSKLLTTNKCEWSKHKLANAFKTKRKLTQIEEETDNNRGGKLKRRSAKKNLRKRLTKKRTTKRR